MILDSVEHLIIKPYANTVIFLKLYSINELMPSGNQSLPEISKKGYEMELSGVNYLKEQGYQILHEAGKINPEGQQEEFDYLTSIRKKLGIVTRLNYGLYDCLCKKGKQYFLFEIKYKIWKEGRLHFNSSERQISEYNRIQKIGKAKVKVLTIIEKDKKLSHHIYDWDDFEKTKTTIKLKSS